MLQKLKKLSLTNWILLALGCGLLTGIGINIITPFLPQGLAEFLETYMINGLFEVIGGLFVNSIKMMVIPLVVISLIVGVSGIGSIQKLGRVGIKTLGLYLLTTSLAITLSLIIAKLMGPGTGLDLAAASDGFTASKAPSLAEVFKDFIPKNPFEALLKERMLQIIFFSLLIGLAIASLGEKVRQTMHFFTELNEIVMKMITMIMLFAPIGIYCLIAKVFSEEGLDVLLPLIKYISTVYLVLLIHLFLVYFALLKFVGKLKVKTFFSKFREVISIAFSTSSSNATIPVSIRNMCEKMGVSKSIASFSIPFGATINMDGTAIMQGVAVIFISQVYSIPLELSHFVTIILTATLASVGTAGVPGIGLITLSMVLTQVNLPIEGIALIIGVDRIIDMARTAVNVTGDGIVSIIVAKSEGEFDEKIYYNEKAGEINPDHIANEIETAIHESHDIMEEENQNT